MSLYNEAKQLLMDQTTVDAMFLFNLIDFEQKLAENNRIEAERAKINFISLMQPNQMNELQLDILVRTYVRVFYPDLCDVTSPKKKTRKTFLLC